MNHRLQSLLRLGTRSFRARETGIRPSGFLWSSRAAATDTGGSDGRTPAIGTFDNSKDAFRGQTTTELLRALIVFRMCAVDRLVIYQGKILKLARFLLGQWSFKKLMRATIYGQFIAGEQDEEILRLAERNKRFGVGSMFAYTAAEMHGSAEGSVGDSGYKSSFFKRNFDGMYHSIDIASRCDRIEGLVPTVTTKFTFLLPADVLRRTNAVIESNQAVLMGLLGSSTGGENKAAIFQALEQIGKMAASSDYTGEFAEVPQRSPVDTDESRLVALTNSLAFHLQLSKNTEMKALAKNRRFSTLGLDDYKEIKKLWTQMNQLAEHARTNNVMLGWDAEQTYLQTAIGVMVLDSMRSFNSERPVVQNTYQCYLKRTHDVISRDLEISEKEGFCFAAKVVRGAYLDEERRLAKENRYIDPVNPDYDATTASYQRVANRLLDDIQRRPRGTVHVTFATHNEDTVRFVIDTLEKRGMSAKGDVLTFAQLLGMRDHIAFTLGKAGYPAVKLLHYGSVEECVAYLSRRALENKSAIPTADKERRMLAREFRRRITSGYIWRRDNEQHSGQTAAP